MEGKKKVKNVLDWYFTGKAEDMGERINSCDLCNTAIRYVYYIQNKITGEILGVGSDCIERFNVTMMKSGVRSSRVETLKEVNKYKYHFKKENANQYVFNTIDKLSWPNIGSYKKNYSDNGYFTPEQSFALFNYLDKQGTVYDKRKFKINVDTKKNMNKFTYQKFKVIEDALTDNQKKECKKFLFND
ncbi:hypothetical protein MKY27_11740 [Solibacillus sp. FSL R5-0449]|uniref:hypothetical protein n=1 Tax=Solibacillus sp. FSL R5-0449 TaxID=2921639 RepID=UPI0030D03BA4